MRSFKLNALLCLVLASFSAHGATSTTMMDGVSNGISTKFNKNCLDVAYKNAYEEADGKKTDSDSFPNYKCYKDGVEIHCNEIREDNQTENAKTDHFVNQLPDGTVCVQLPDSEKVYDGTEEACDTVTYKNAFYKICGVADEISSFRCYSNRVAIDCSKLTDDAQIDKAKEDCDAATVRCNSAEVCAYGGKVSSTNGCQCNAAPDCSGTYGGKPLGDGTQECEYYQAPDCPGLYGGKPAANGTQECLYNSQPDCSGTYGGTPKANGTQECTYYAAPDCSSLCQYGGTPKANGTQECSCKAERTCAEACSELGASKGVTYTSNTDNGDGTCKCCYKKTWYKACSKTSK